MSPGIDSGIDLGGNLRIRREKVSKTSSWWVRRLRAVARPPRVRRRHSSVFVLMLALSGVFAAVAAGEDGAGSTELEPRAAVARDTVAALHVEGATTIEADEAWREFREGTLFVDVRMANDFDVGRIPGAFNLPIHRDDSRMENAFTKSALLALAGGLDAPMVLYCNAQRCWRTEEAVRRAVGWGFEGVLYFRYGFPAWRSAGYPVE